MSEFINALMKTEPELFKTENEKQEPNNASTMSLQDMKDYFDAMKESMMSEFKKEIDAIKVQSTINESNTDKGDTNNGNIENEQSKKEE